MEFVVGSIGVLVFCIILLWARHVRTCYVLKRNHFHSLMRLDEQTRVSLPPLAGELVSAAIDEELNQV